MDVLSEVLRVVRLSGTIHFRAEFTHPWAILSSPPVLLAARLQASEGSVTPFHVVKLISVTVDQTRIGPRCKKARISVRLDPVWEIHISSWPRKRSATCSSECASVALRIRQTQRRRYRAATKSTTRRIRRSIRVLVCEAPNPPQQQACGEMKQANGRVVPILCVDVNARARYNSRRAPKVRPI